MNTKKVNSTIGSWAFLVGVVIAVLIAFFGTLNESLLWLLVAIGVIIGFLNVSDEETEPFLMSGAVLIIVSALGQSVVSVSVLFSRLLESILLIFIPATIIVAIKNVFLIARR